MAGVLDSARFRTFIAEELGVSVEDVHAFVLGGHGDTMVPLPLLDRRRHPDHRAAAAPTRSRRSRTGPRTAARRSSLCSRPDPAFYAPAASTFEMVDAILRDRRRVLPCAVYLQGEYGVDGLFVGVPVVLGAGGLERVIEITLTPDETAAFQKSVAAVQELVDKLPS